jgi:hypothetical protein
MDRQLEVPDSYGSDQRQEDTNETQCWLLLNLRLEVLSDKSYDLLFHRGRYGIFNHKLTNVRRDIATRNYFRHNLEHLISAVELIFPGLPMQRTLLPLCLGSCTLVLLYFGGDGKPCGGHTFGVMMNIVCPASLSQT